MSPPAIMFTRRNGSLLIITLWLVSILAVLVVAIARHLSLDLRLTKYRQALDQAKTLARSGIYLGMQRLAQDGHDKEQGGKEYDWLGDEWASFPPPEGSGSGSGTWVVRFPAEQDEAVNLKGQVEIQIIDEDRKLNVNTATSEQLQRLLDSAELAQAIVDYHDAPAPEETMSVEPPYEPKNGPVVALEELADVPGITGEPYDKLVASMSPYLGDLVKQNINTVTPAVMQVLGLRESTIQSITDFRDGADGPAAHAQDGIFQEAGRIRELVQNRTTLDDTELTVLDSAFGVSSQTFTVTSTGIVDDPSVRARVEAVVRRSGCAEGVPSPCIIAWREG